MGKTIVSEDGRFEWDEEKDIINKADHGLYFSEPIEESAYYEWRKHFIT